MNIQILPIVKKILIVAILCIVISIVFMFKDNGRDKEKFIENINNIQQPLSNPEKDNPSAFMDISFNYHERFLASDYVEIKLQNNADKTTYKNIHYHIKFLDNAGNVLTSENYSWNNIITPHQLLTIDVEHKFRGDRRFIQVGIDAIEVAE